MPREHHKAGLTAIEQYRWFTIQADVSLTANTHLQNPDLKKEVENKGLDMETDRGEKGQSQAKDR